MFLLIAALFTPYFPPSDGGDWEVTTDGVAGVDSALLDEAMAFAEEKNSRGVVILHEGKILREEYWGGWDENTRGPSYSAAKSVVATLMGAAIGDGFVEGVEQKSADFLAEWQSDTTKQEITIGDQLAMSTGLRENPLDLVVLQLASSERNYASGLDADFEPGTRWYYHNPGYRLNFYILEEATGMATDLYMRERLFERIGMVNSELLVREEQLLGQTIRNYQWIDWTARDASRFGLLALRDGEWGGEQVVGAEWMQKMLQPAREEQGWYGLLWWLNQAPEHRVPLMPERRSGRLFPDVPVDAVAALGKDDQKVYVVPSLELVVVRLGEAADATTPGLSSFDNEFLGGICQAFGFEGEEQELTLDICLEEDVRLSFETWNGRSYCLEAQVGLDGDWHIVAEVEGDGLAKELNVEIEPQMFFRLK